MVRSPACRRRKLIACMLSDMPFGYAEVLVGIFMMPNIAMPTDADHPRLIDLIIIFDMLLRTADTGHGVWRFHFHRISPAKQLGGQSPNLTDH